MKILLATLGSLGDINPYIGLARALQRRGYETDIATSARYRESVEAAGIGFHGVRPHIDPDDPQLLRRVMDARRGPEFLIADLLMPAIEQSYEDLDHAAVDSDLLITHPVTFAGPIVAEARRLPWLSAVLAPLSFLSAFDPPALAPAPSTRGFFRLSPALTGLIFRIAKRHAASWTGPLVTLRKRLGLPSSANPLFEGQHSPNGVLALFSRVLAAPQPDWPPGVTITGPVFDDRTSGVALDATLERFLDEGPPPVVFTLGSAAVGAAGSFYQESAKAARSIGCRAVLLTGDHEANRIEGSDDILVTDRAPFTHLFPRAAAVVHSGGIGTTQQALRAGRPSLIVPWAHDQPDNAARVADLGAARILRPARYRSAAAGTELRRILENGRYARAASGAARLIAAESGAESACDVIERLTRSARLT